MVTETTPEKIRKQQAKFMADNFTLVIFEGGSSGTNSNVIYTVPVGKVAYVNNVQLEGRTSGSTQVTFLLSINNFATLIHDWGAVTDAFTTESFNFPIPIKMAAGQEIKVRGVIGPGSFRGAGTLYEDDA